MLILLLLFTNLIFSQRIENFNDFVESEMKSASKVMNIAVNPNTSNYDITYHKLEFSVGEWQHHVFHLSTNKGKESRYLYSHWN